MHLLYTRIILLLAALGLASSAVAGGQMVWNGQYGTGLLMILLAIGIGYVWYQDWMTLDKCTTCLARVDQIMAKEQ